MTMVHELCAPVSNKGDWHYATQLRSENNTDPLWETPPEDLETSIVFVDARGRQAYATSSGDGLVTVENDSYLTIDLPASSMSSLSEGRYAVHVKYETAGTKTHYLLGYLPVYEGF
jgi:hypothetical protein